MTSLSKALDLLEVFLNEQETHIGFTDLINSSGLNKATGSRIISVLLKRGYLNQFARRNKYSLGMKFLHYSHLIKNGMKINNIAAPYLTELAASVKECVFLAVRYHNTLIIVEVIESKYVLKAAPEIGTDVPLYCTGIGKMLLSILSEKELQEYFDHTNMFQFSPNTITNVDILKKQLKTIAREGISYDYEEKIEGISSIAAPIMDANLNFCAVVSVLGPSLRLTPERMKVIAAKLKDCADKISKELGYLHNEINKESITL